MAAAAGDGSARPGEKLRLVFLERPSPVDANLGPWSPVAPATFAVGATPATLRLAWDETALRVLFEVGDATHVTLGREDEDPDLGLKSDSVELFLDVRGEAMPRMDTNDYQFTVSRDGRRTTFKGSSALSGTVRPEPEADAAPQPKDWGMNVPIEVAVADGPEAGPGKSAGLPRRDRRAVGGRGRQAGARSGVRSLGRGERPRDAPGRARPDAHVGRFPGPVGVRVARRVGGGGAAAAGISSRAWRETHDPGRPWLSVCSRFSWPWAGACGRRPSSGPPAPPPVLAAGEMPVSGDDPIERLKQNLPSRLREDLTAETLAEIAGVSLRTLQRIFRERFDTTPMSWLMEVRLLEAARVIRAGDDPVTKIAYRVGFKDPSHFTRRFKARFGVSPNEYRRGAEGAPEPPAGGSEDAE